MMRLEKQGSRQAGVVTRLLAMRERMIGALLLGNNIANIGASALATGLFTAWFGDVGVLYATGVMTVLVVIFAEVLPKTYAIMFPDRSALTLAPMVRVVVWLFAPPTVAVEAIVRGILRGLGVQRRSLAQDAELNELSMRDLRHEVWFSRSRLTHQVNRLVGAELLKKTSDAGDGRVQVVALTAAGSELIDRAQQLVRQALRDHFFSQLPPSTERDLVSLLANLVEHLRQQNAEVRQHRRRHQPDFRRNQTIGQPLRVLVLEGQRTQAHPAQEYGDRHRFPDRRVPGELSDDLSEHQFIRKRAHGKDGGRDQIKHQKTPRARKASMTPTRQSP